MGLEEPLTPQSSKQLELPELGAVTPDIPVCLEGENTETTSAVMTAEEAAANLANTPSMVFAKVEKSLISLGFFTPSSRRIKDQKVKRISFTRTIRGKKVEATAEFHPSAVFGLPITADQDKFIALHDIIASLIRTDGKITNPIRFTSADLLRLLNKRVRTGKNYKDICEWLDVMTATTIISNGVVYEAGKQRFARDRFHVFERAVSIGKELPDGSIADANYVWLSEWQLENINQNFLLPIDLLTYRELKNHIAKALVPLLQIWLFASQRVGSFEKRYDELCEMLSLQIYKAPSLITRQLRPSLDELVRYEYLEKWRIEKTSDGKAYKIIFFHGPKFHRDRRRRIDQKTETEPPIVIAESEPDLPEPGKLELETDAAQPGASATPSKPHTAPAGKGAKEKEFNLIDELSARGLMPSVAMKLIASTPPDRQPEIVDYMHYWDSIRTQKRAGLLIKLIEKGDPLPASFQTRREKEEQRIADDRQRKLGVVKNALTVAYEEHRRSVVDRCIEEQLTPAEFERRVVAHKKEHSVQAELWSRSMSPEAVDHMARNAVRAQIAEVVTVLPFDEFRQRELPKILAELQLDPAELGIDLPSTPAVVESATA